MTTVTELIRKRRAIFPKTYLPGKPIDASFIQEILENANHAPTHKRTEPWRFQVFHSEESRQALGNMLSGFFQKNSFVFIQFFVAILIIWLAQISIANAQNNARALPTAGQVVAGTAVITQSGLQTQVNQSSQMSVS